MDPGRIKWIDIAKGMAILFVMVGHLGTKDWTYVIYAFHVPLWFWLSGITFDRDKYENLGHLIVKKIKSLIIPYWVIAVITYLLWAVRDWSSRWGVSFLWKIIYGNGNFGLKDFNAALWFLPCLFVVEILWWGLTRINNKMLWMLMLAVSGLVGYMLGDRVNLPLGGEVALTGMVFFGLGDLTKSIKLNALAMTVLPILFASATVFNFKLSGIGVDMRINFLGVPWLFYSAAISGVFICLKLAQMLISQPLLEYLGKNSLILFAWHQAIFMYLDVVLRPHIPASKWQMVMIDIIYIPLASAVILLADRGWKKLREQT